MDALDALDATRLTARLDVAGLGEGTTAVDAQVNLPDGVELRSISPAQVAVTVTAVATPRPTPTPTPTASPTPTPTPVP
jgi:YbbR domain-containing protein